MNSEEQYYERARKRVKRKKEFYQHLASFVAVNGFLFLLNLFTNPGQWWFVFPMLGWGVGLASHYFAVFGLPGTSYMKEGWEEKEIESEVERMRQRNYDYPASDDIPEGTVVPDEELELKEFKKLRREWDDSEFV